MSRSRSVARLAVAAIALAILARPVAAQVTTGTLTGTVKDAQGAVIPGATVAITSDTRGTQLPVVVSNTSGDFTFVNVPARHLHDSDHDGRLQDAQAERRAGERRRPRMRSARCRSKSAALAETVSVTGEAPPSRRSSGERSFTVSRESVENLPIASRSYMALAVLAPGVTLDNNNTPVRLGGGGDPNIMMDGVSAMDTGSNRPLLQMNVESIAEVKVLTSGYQAEYGRSSGVQVTAITKSGTNRFRGVVYDVERNSDWNSNSKTNKLNGDPEAGPRRSATGASRSAARSGSPAATTSCSSSTARSSRRAPPATTSSASACRPRSSARETSRRRPTTTASLYPYIKDPLLDRRLHGGEPGRLLRGRRRGRPHSGEPPLPAGAEHPEAVSAAQHRQRPGGQNYNYEITRPEESVLSWQPAVRVDYQPTQKLRASVQVLGVGAAGPGLQRHDPRLQRHEDAERAGRELHRVGQLHAHADDVPRGDLRAQPERAGRMRAGAVGQPAPSSATTPVGRRACRSRRSRAWPAPICRDLPFLFPDATVLDPDYYAVKALNEIQPAFWDGTRMSKVPTFSVGQPRRRTRRRRSGSPAGSTSTRPTTSPSA